MGGVTWREWVVTTVAALSLTACTPWRMAYLRDAVDRATQGEITTGARFRESDSEPMKVLSAGR